MVCLQGSALSSHGPGRPFPGPGSCSDAHTRMFSQHNRAVRLCPVTNRHSRTEKSTSTAGEIHPPTPPPTKPPRKVHAQLLPLPSPASGWLPRPRTSRSAAHRRSARERRAPGRHSSVRPEPRENAGTRALGNGSESSTSQCVGDKSSPATYSLPKE